MCPMDPSHTSLPGYAPSTAASVTNKPFKFGYHLCNCGHPQITLFRDIHLTRGSQSRRVSNLAVLNFPVVPRAWHWGGRATGDKRDLCFTGLTGRPGNGT